MNSIFRKLLYKRVLAKYINNFVIPTKTKKNSKNGQFVLKIAKKHNLSFNQSKYNFNVKEIPILRVVVRWGEVKVENDKTKAVKE